MDNDAISILDVREVFGEGLSLNQIYEFEDAKDRRLYLDCDVERSVVSDVVRHILRFNKEDKGTEITERKPIYLFISSDGGGVDDGLELVDVIKASKTPVYTVTMGYCYSMAFLIFLAGHKRFASKHATFLIHDGSSYIYNSGSKARDTMEYLGKVEKGMRLFVVENSSITLDEYEKREKDEWYMFSDEAKQKGIVDYIVGEDVEIDDVL